MHSSLNKRSIGYYNANEKKEEGSVLVILGGYDMMMLPSVDKGTLTVLFTNRAAVMLAGAAWDRESPRPMGLY